MSSKKVQNYAYLTREKTTCLLLKKEDLLISIGGKLKDVLIRNQLLSCIKNDILFSKLNKR